MKKKLATAISGIIVLFGVMGCGSGGDGVSTPSYAQKVTVDEGIARKTMSLLDNGNIENGMGGLSAGANIDNGLLTPEKFEELIGSVLGRAQSNKMHTREGGGEDESADINETYNCSYAGSYHKERQTVKTELGIILSRVERTTYIDCVHNVDLESDGEVSDVKKYFFNGSIEESGTYTKNTSDEIATLKDYKVKHVRISDEMLLFDAEADFSEAYYSEEEEDRNMRREAYAGTIDAKEYNTTGDLISGFKLEAKEFVESREWIESSDRVTRNWDGYLFVSNDLNSSKDKYLYADHFVAIYEDDDLEKETYNGILGSNCFGGAVEISTSSSWDTNRSIAEVDRLDAGMQADVWTPRGRTPFRGQTVITGKESSVTIQFGINGEDKAYGKFIFDDGTESVPMRRSDMESELCHEADG